jgi:hypothetical protein
MAYHLDQLDPDERGGFYADEDEEEYAPRSRRVLRIAGALVVMGIFAGGLWFAYTLGMRHTGGSANSGEIPLIHADNRPIKVKPENPGGMQIPDRDMFIYGQQRPEVEHLLPPPEQPMARPAPPPPSPNPPVAANALSANPLPAHPLNPPVAANPLPAQPSSTAPSSATPAPAAASESAGAAVPPSVPPAPAPVPAPVASAEEASPAPAATSAATSPAKPIAPRQPQPSPAAVAAAEMLGISPAPARPTAARGGSAHFSGMRLQLGAMRSESEARGQWEQMKRKNPDLLGNLSGATTRADLGDQGTYYRIQTGPVTDPASADRICAELRQRHFPCMVVR